MNGKCRILQYSVQTQTTCADVLTRLRADARTDVSSKVNYRGACAPKNYLKFLLMTSHLDSHTTTDVKPDMLSGVQIGNGITHDRYNTRGFAHVCTNRKDDIFMQRRPG